MQNDSSVRHIAITCPFCNKRYRKVPYEAIKKYSSAFCKQCEAKFHITAEELEEALQQALQASQRDIPAAQVQDQESPGHDKSLEQKITTLAATMEETFSQSPASGGKFPAVNDAEERQNEDEATELPSNHPPETAEDAAAVAAPETESNEIESLPDLLPPVETGGETETQQAPGQDEAGTPREETVPFEQLPVSDFAEGIAQENAAGVPTGVDQPVGSDSQDSADQKTADATDLLAAEPETEGLRPDDELSQAHPSEPPLGEVFPALHQNLTEKDFSAAEDSPEAMDSAVTTLPEPQVEPFQDAVPDESMSQDLTFASPGRESCHVEPCDDASSETETQQALEQDKSGSPREETVSFEQLPVSGFTEEVVEENAAGDDQTPSASEVLSFEDEPAADEPVAEDSLLQNDWTEVAQTTSIDEPLTGQPEPPEEEAGEVPRDSGNAAPDADLMAVSSEEEFLDESLIEEEPEAPTQESIPRETLPGDLPEQQQARQTEEALSPRPNESQLDAMEDAEGNRDVSAMLKQLALPADEIEEGMEQFVLFSLGQQTFAAPIANVFELSLPPELISVPNTPPWILGISNMRGEIISVVDLKGFMNIAPERFKKPTRMIIAQTLDKDMILGLTVDRIKCIKYFSVEEIQPLDQHATGLSDAFFLGTCMDGSEAVIFLDLEQILQSSKMRQFQ